MDPPPPQHVEDAVGHLSAIGALFVAGAAGSGGASGSKGKAGSVDPTELGRMLCSFKMNVSVGPHNWP